MVERAHVIPHVRPYTVAQHTYGVCCLCQLLWPSQPHLLEFALFHDLPERWTGDVPGQVLNMTPALRKIFSEMDQDISMRFQLPSEHKLSKHDRACLKAADRLELWLWTYEEEAMGNRLVLGCRAELDTLFDNAADLPPEVRSIINHVRRHGFHRLGETLN